MGTINNLSFCTYNIRGFNSTKIDYINQLLIKYDILLIQEHWLNNYQISSLAGHFPQYNVHGVSAVDSGVILQGRPHGGCLILYTNINGRKIRFVTNQSKRMCSLCINIGDIFFVFA